VNYSNSNLPPDILLINGTTTKPTVHVSIRIHIRIQLRTASAAVGAWQASITLVTGYLCRHIVLLSKSHREAVLLSYTLIYIAIRYVHLFVELFCDLELCYLVF